MTKKDLAISIDGKAFVFRALQVAGHTDDSRVVCPGCIQSFARKKARQHCKSCKEIIEVAARADQGDEAGDYRNERTNPTKKRLHSEIEDATGAWKRLCGAVPPNMLLSTMESMNANAYHINGCPLILPLETFELLQSLLPKEYVISKIDVSEEDEKVDARV